MNDQPSKRIFHHRKKISDKDAKMIYEHYQQYGEQAAKNLCDQYGYSTSSFYRIIENRGNVTEAWIHPPHPKKWSQDMIDQAISIIEDNPRLFLNEIIQKCVDEYHFPPICDTTLSEYLDDSLISLKSINYQSIERNSEHTKDLRVDYVHWLIEHQNYSFIYVDETGYSIGVQRNRGRAPIGQRITVNLPLEQSSNVSAAVAISKDYGILHYKAIEGSFNINQFDQFIADLVQIIKTKQIYNPCIIMDNCRCHKREDINSICGTDVLFRFLPPYSPNLNPIENVFAIVKQNFRTVLANLLHEDLLATSKLPWGRKTQRRNDLLNTGFVLAISQIDKTIIENCYSHLGHYENLALNKADI